jgi:hypothetical protein
MENLPTILFNDEDRTLQFKLMDSEGTGPLNLTGMTIVFAIGDAKVAPQFTDSMTITSALLGLCEITLTPAEINALTSGNLRYSIRQTAPVNRVLQYGFVEVAVTF